MRVRGFLSLGLAALAADACASGRPAAARQAAVTCPARLPGDSGQVYVAREVARRAVPVGDTPLPDAPLRNEWASGAVRLVVDTAGLVEAGSVAVVRASEADFAAALAGYVRDWRFRPAELVPGCRVRQLVELPLAARRSPDTPTTVEGTPIP